MTISDKTVENPFGDLLSYSDEVPVEWELVEQEPEAAYLKRLNETNEALLRVAGILGEHRLEVDEHMEFVVELQRLEQKVDLMLEMLGIFMMKHMELPARRHLRLNPKGVAIRLNQGEQRVEVGSRLMLSIYIQPEIPRPVRFFGQVVEATRGELIVGFLAVDHVVEDWMEKTVFKHHRRQVARQREGVRK